MSKGKKFDAAEKHFAKKETAYRRKIQELADQNSKLNAELRSLKQRTEKLESENEQLNDWVERLLKFTELSAEQLAAHIQAIQKISKMTEMTESLGLLSAHRIFCEKE